MGRAVLIGLGGLFTLAMIGASMAMNFLFGFGFGTTAAAAWVWGGLSVASDGLKSVLPVLIAYQARRRHVLRAFTGVLILPLVLGYGFLSALGFWSESRGLVVGGRSFEKSSVAQAQTELGRAEKRLAAVGAYRLAGVIEADMAGLQRERLWAATRECREAAAAGARVFCKRMDALRAELALNHEGQALVAKTEALKFEIKSGLAKGAWRDADPQGAAIASMLGVDVPSVRTGLSWMAAMLVEIVSCFGLLVVGEAGLLEGLKRAGEKSVKKPVWRLVGEAADAQAVKAGARG